MVRVGITRPLLACAHGAALALLFREGCARAGGPALVAAVTRPGDLWWALPLAFAWVAGLVVLQWLWSRRSRTWALAAVRWGCAAAVLAAGYLAFLSDQGRAPVGVHGDIVAGPRVAVERDPFPGRPPVAYRFNAQGFRGPEWGPRKPGVRRGMLVGDSFAFGLGVEWDDTLGEAVARRLREAPDHRDVEVVNVGIAGLNLRSNVDVYEALRGELDPDFVVMTLVGWNDLSPQDAQGFLRRVRTVGAVSFAAFLCPAVRPLWDFVFDRWATLDRDGAVRILDEQLLRLRRLREGARGPFVVVGYYVEDEAVRARLLAEPSIVFLDLHVDPAETLPGDGHPTPALNRRAAAEIVDRIGDIVLH